MYHLELRKFPHSFWRFNLSERELFDSILAPWVRDVLVEAGERRWNPREATLTVVEGPELAVQELSMGRGWRNAVRRGEDVTARVLSAARERAQRERDREQGSGRAGAAGGRGDAAGGRASGPGGREPADAAYLRELLGEDAEALMSLWRAARERHPERTPSECLALAEDAVRSLDDR